MCRAEAAAGGRFQRPAVAGFPAVAPGGRGSTGPGVVLPDRRDSSGWLAGGEGLHAGDRCGELAGPGPGRGEAQPCPAAAAHQPPGGGEQPQAQALGFPGAGGTLQCQHRRPGQQFTGHGHQFAPQLVLGEAYQAKVPQAPVSFAPRILASGPPTVPQFQVRELAALRVGGEGGPSRPKTPRPLVLRALLFTQKVPSARDGWDSRQALLSQFKGTFHANRRPQAIPAKARG